MSFQNCSIIQLIIISLFPITIISQNLSFQQKPIDLSFEGIHAIKVIDLDDDGDLDIVGGSEIGPSNNSIGIHWLRNDGGDPITWTRVEVDVNFEHVMSVDVGYINNDTYPDIVATSWSLHQVAWWENSGDPNLDWSKRIIRSSFFNAHDAKCSDIDQDGDTDIISASHYSNSILISQNDGSSSVNWQNSFLTTSYAGAQRVLVTDLDKDNDLDILGTATDAGQVAWWRNLGGNPLTWLKIIIGSDFLGSSDLYVIDMNGDQLLDVVANAWISEQVAYWLSNDSTGNSWSKVVVTNSLEVPGKVSAADFDDDGDIDVLAVGKIPGELVIYENNNFIWSEHILASPFYGGTALEVIDLDGDTDLDIVAGASYIGELYWWENFLITSVEENDNANLPNNYKLYQNYPNPFNPATIIKYNVPENSYVTLSVYNLLGKEIATVFEGKKSPGKYEIKFDAENLSSGTYFYQLQAGEVIQTKKMMLLR